MNDQKILIGYYRLRWRMALPGKVTVSSTRENW